MKKRKWFAVTLLVIVLWLAVGITDFFRVYYFERPVFCILVNGADDGGSGTYLGLGYSFVIEGNFMPEDEFPGVTRYEYQLFGLDVCEGIRD